MQTFRPKLSQKHRPKPNSKQAAKERRQFSKYSGRIVKSAWHTPSVHY